MIVPFSRICHDFLAVRGESPDLLPVLQDGEESAVLTLEAWLRTVLISRAVEATMHTDPSRLEEFGEFTMKTGKGTGFEFLTPPADFLRFISLSIGENAPPKTTLNKVSDLRFRRRKRDENEGLPDRNNSGGCTFWKERTEPEACILPDGRILIANSGEETAEEKTVTLRYVPRPFLDSSDLLHISEAAYEEMIKGFEKTD